MCLEPGLVRTEISEVFWARIRFECSAYRSPVFSGKAWPEAMSINQVGLIVPIPANPVESTICDAAWPASVNELAPVGIDGVGGNFPEE